MKIKAGGNLIIEDSSFSVTEIHTDVKITDMLDISNDGTGPALVVRQFDTSAQDIARFMDGDTIVFVIRDGGVTNIVGNVSMESSLEISNNLFVRNDLFVDNDVSFGGELTIMGNVYINSILDISGTIQTIDGDDFILKTGASERMIIDSSGIKFVNGDSRYTAVDISSTSALGLPVGTTGERPSNNKIGDIRYNETDKQFEGCGENETWQGLGGVVDLDQDTKITTDNSNNLLFDTRGSTQMTIDSSGDVSMANNLYVSLGIGIGKYKDADYDLDVSGDIHCTGTLYADSDLNVKKNLVPLDNALDKISKLNGYYYHKVGEKDDSMRHVGVIAQEVEAEYPELVSKNTDIKSVNYDGINAILIECVKELYAKNNTLKQEIEIMKILINTHLTK
jgi:hypothetical protein